MTDRPSLRQQNTIQHLPRENHHTQIRTESIERGFSDDGAADIEEDLVEDVLSRS